MSTISDQMHDIIENAPQDAQDIINHFIGRVSIAESGAVEFRSMMRADLLDYGNPGLDVYTLTDEQFGAMVYFCGMIIANFV